MEQQNSLSATEKIPQLVNSIDEMPKLIKNIKSINGLELIENKETDITLYPVIYRKYMNSERV